MTMRILLAGQKWFGAEVFRALRAVPGVQIAAVAAPPDDRLGAQAALRSVPIIRAGTLNAATMPAGIDLIVAAHSHDFIGERTRSRARLGGIGYHPSLLPLHRGRDAIRWTIRDRDRITGGTVYRLSNRMDGGPVLAQDWCFVRPQDDAETLWRRDLAPMGVRLLVDVVDRMSREGYIEGTPQDESMATFEPSMTPPPAFRPDLPALPAPRRQAELDEDARDIIAALRMPAKAI